MTKDELAKAARLWASGQSTYTIGKILGIGEAEVMRYLQQIKKLAEQP